MEDSTRLFGSKKKKDWLTLRLKIHANPLDLALWNATAALMKERIDTRYFVPIRALIKLKTNKGEGFSVVALLCSLIEFYQSCYEGKFYKYNSQETKFMYGKSGEKFKAFLTTHEPFKNIFAKPIPNEPGKTYADDFYTNVRCGLLHEASTKNFWEIKTAGRIKVKAFCDLTDNRHKVIYRDKLFIVLDSFWDRFLTDLPTADDKTKSAFCRKMDSLCEIYHDKNMTWWA